MSAFAGAALAVALAALAVRMAGRMHRLLHLLQLEHYESARLTLWLRRRSELLAWRELLALAALYGAAVADIAAGSEWVAGALLLASTPIALPGVADWRRPAAKPLVFTGRARRLFAVAMAPAAGLAVAAVVLAALGSGGVVAAATLLGAGWLLLAASPWVLAAANVALRPVQGAIDRGYVRSARHRLAEVAPLVIGVTGSYGKTSTKMCVGAVLGADRPTLVTPASFNSHLGVVRTINEHLCPEHEAFVVEMGMFRRGDIAELCELTHPKIGILTAIGPMHLERLGSIEAIAAAKAELMEALPADGHLIVNGDDPRCMEIAHRAHVPVTTFGLQSADADVRAGGLTFTGGRSELDLRLGRDAEPVHLSAQLLGRHNALNLLAAAAVGHVLGVPADRIAAALARVKPPEHRLAPIENPATGVLVIDDAYNSNPDGAAAALEVLAMHGGDGRGRRLLVTPGMVELGEMEQELNRGFGQRAAGACEIAILVGGQRRVAAIREGLLAGGMAAECIETVPDLTGATALLSSLTRPGDVILFENDLPDTYAEDGGGHQ